MPTAGRPSIVSESTVVFSTSCFAIALLSSGKQGTGISVSLFCNQYGFLVKRKSISNL